MNGPVLARKRPIVVGAYDYYDGTNAADVAAWIISRGGEAWIIEGELIIDTLEGHHTVQVNDRVIRGTAGEFYTIRDYVWFDVYDLVGERS